MLPAEKRCITIEHYCSTILLLYTTIEPHAESRAHWSVWPPEVTDTGGAYRFVAIWPYLVRVRRRLWFRVKLELTLGPRHMLGGGANVLYSGGVGGCIGDVPSTERNPAIH